MERVAERLRPLAVRPKGALAVDEHRESLRIKTAKIETVGLVSVAAKAVTDIDSRAEPGFRGFEPRPSP